MARENVLLSPQIASSVLAHLSPGPLSESDSKRSPRAAERRKERQTTLARLACVCRAISSPALDILWEHIDKFRHILFALKPYDRKQAKFTDDITDSDWARFQEYAARVRSLRLGEIKKVHWTVWVLLTRRCPQGPLLPRLESLTGFKVNERSPGYTMLLSPSVVRLELQISSSAEKSVVRMTLQAAQPTLSAVRDFTIDDQAHAAKEKDAPETIPYWTLSHLHALRIVHKTALTIQILESLAAFPDLRKLDLHIKELPQIPTGALAAGFTCLRELKLTGRLGDICAFVAATAPPNLEILAINAPDLCDPERVSDGIHAQTGSTAERSLDPLYAHLPPSLRSLEATLRCRCDQGFYHFPEANKLLAPLRAVYGLRSISLTFEGPKTHLSDSALLALQDAWPGLVAFELFAREPKPKQPVYDRYAPRARRYRGPPEESDYECRSRPLPPPPRDHPTLRTLAAFAQAHPRLERLALLSVDLDEVPDLRTVPLLGHTLRYLEFSTLASGIGLYQYALAFDMLFPHLDLDHVQDAVMSAAAGERNTELQLLLLALQAGRLGRHRERVVNAAGGVRDASEIVLTRRKGAPPPAADDADGSDSDESTRSRRPPSVFGEDSAGDARAPSRRTARPDYNMIETIHIRDDCR
ncbi:hypothetical protein OH77DRAFT_1498242 [Trametes cingulata]|nr:hypothetical protein OH77DRAFT_1498242 [Trametes cingulata]